MHILMRMLVALAMSVTVSTAASAAEYNGPIRIVVPFAAGGATDALARLLAPGLAKELGHTVVVENRPGASGQIGTAYVKNAPADGSVYLLALDHSVVIVPLMTPSAGYDALRDFAPIGTVARFQWVLSVPISSPATTLQQFMDLTKKDASKRNYGVPLMGGMPDLIGASIGGKAGVGMEAIPFNGSAQMMPQLIGGQLASGVTGSPEAVTMSRARKVRLLAVTGDKRSPLLPEVPTFAEADVKGLNLNSFNAFFAPKNLPPPIADKFNAALRKTLADPDVRKQVGDMSLDIVESSSIPEAKAELERTYRFWNSAAAAKH
ncbi:BUG/TctC family periplasmic protein [Cupriavidus sp. U2]|uniref:Bug family tripartite tricarboxylate transporter substrate binding protein n=1 Tax=Cupriavidus sp. U2 TaxID=2920269 RepID=UPI001E2FD390|nr:tripartite tricarboxylate transporter substrate binding protein [Cupriavidus sp. U2]KAI3591745.1 BUG/TctC family periplasmic protein [Cupriavidus sp. U2]